MDFRNVDPANVKWQRGGRQGNVLASVQHGKVLVQTPKCPCSVNVHSAGVFRIDMKLGMLNPLHERFAAWVGDVERNASGPWKTDLVLSSTIYGSNFRVMAFSDTMTFDERGELSADIISAKSCSALLELTGAWTSNGKWGLRWRVVQVKFSTEGHDECLFVDDDDDDGNGFVEVDD